MALGQKPTEFTKTASEPVCQTLPTLTCTLLCAISPGVGQLIASPKSPTCKAQSMKTPELLRLGHFAPHPSSSFSERFGPLHLAHSRHQAQVPRKTGQKCLQEQEEESPTSITHPAPYLAALALFRSSCSHYLGWSRRFCWNKESKQLFRACVTTVPI